MERARDIRVLLMAHLQQISAGRPPLPHHLSNRKNTSAIYSTCRLNKSCGCHERLPFVPLIISSPRFLSISIHIDTIGSTPPSNLTYYLLESECHRGTGAHFLNAMRRTKFETIPATHRPDARASLTNQTTTLDDPACESR